MCLSMLVPSTHCFMRCVQESHDDCFLCNVYAVCAIYMRCVALLGIDGLCARAFHVHCFGCATPMLNRHSKPQLVKSNLEFLKEPDKSEPTGVTIGSSYAYSL